MTYFRIIIDDSPDLGPKNVILLELALFPLTC